MDFSAARYFDDVDRKEAEEEEKNPTPRISFLRGVWVGIIG